MATEEKKLLEKIRRFCRERDIAEWAFGRIALNDPNFVSRLAAGSSPRLSTVQKIEEFIKRRG